MTNLAFLLSRSPLFWDRIFGQKLTKSTNISACVCVYGSMIALLTWVILHWKADFYELNWVNPGILRSLTHTEKPLAIKAATNHNT